MKLVKRAWPGGGPYEPQILFLTGGIWIRLINYRPLLGHPAHPPDFRTVFRDVFYFFKRFHLSLNRTLARVHFTVLTSTADISLFPF
jgi:hypothetical protein